MSFSAWFDRRNDTELRLTCYLQKPGSLKTGKDITWMDSQAARMIAECEATASKLRDYRQALAARYAELETLPYTYRLELHRHPAWNGHGVTYELLLVKLYADGTEINEHRKTYPGTERRTALKMFDQMKRQRPGIESVLDIAKRQWER